MVSNVLQVICALAMPWLSVRTRLVCITLDKRSPLVSNVEGSPGISMGLLSLNDALWQALVRNVPTPLFGGADWGCKAGILLSTFFASVHGL